LVTLEGVVLVPEPTLVFFSLGVFDFGVFGEGVVEEVVSTSEDMADHFFLI
jgi:hypothetical protein